MKNRDSIIFKAFPLPALLLLPDAPYFTIAGVNNAYLKVTGRKEANLQGKYFFDTVLPFSEETNADVAILQQSLITVISTAKPNTTATLKHDIHVGNMNKPEVRYWNYKHIPVPDSEGKIIFIIHAVHDVTEKVLLKEMEEKSRHPLPQSATVDIGLSKIQETEIRLIESSHDAPVNIEKKISDSEQFYSTLFEQDLAGFYQTTVEGIILNCNDAFARMLKYGSAKELLNTNAAELYFSSSERNNFIAAAINKKKLYSNEGVLKCKDGSRLYFLENISLRKNSITGEEFCEGIIIDITKRKLAEDSLITASAKLQHALTEQILSRKETEQSEKRFRQIVETAQEGIWLINENDATTLVNKKMCEIIEYSREELIGKKIYHFMNDESKRNSLLQIERRKLGMNEIHDAVFCTKSGKQVWVNVSTNPVLNEQGEYKGALAMITDITERKRAELAVTEAFEEKNTILESIGDAFFTVDKTWIVTYWNNQAEKMLRIPRSEILGHHLWHVFSGNINSESYRKYHEAFETGEVIHFEDYYAPLTTWYEISAYPSGNGLSVYFKDITDRKLSDIRLKELNESLQKQTKELAISNAELEQFAYVASHDLQEPLRMVTGFLSQLEKKYMDIIDDKGKQYIAFAVDGAKRMRQIILDLLEFSRVGRMEDKQEDVDLPELVKEIQILVQRQIEETKAVISVENLPVIHTYKAALHQVFQNLISNALKYTKKGIPPLINVNARKLKGEWQFSITDNGIGINEDDFESIFVIFQRLHSRSEIPGTGLGLAITKKIIENLGGKIWLESKEGTGSTFYFTLLR